VIILVVEDTPAVMECLVAGLELAGHEVVEATTAAEAFEALDFFGSDGERGLDGVICDGFLPFRPGVRVAIWGPEVVTEARKRGVPAVVLSARNDTVEECRRAGLPALLKPAGIPEILKALEAQRAGVVKERG